MVQAIQTGSYKSAIVIAEWPLAAATNPAHGLCVPIFDALTVSGWKGYRGHRREGLDHLVARCELCSIKERIPVVN
jgi:hypothetical protein